MMVASKNVEPAEQASGYARLLAKLVFDQVVPSRIDYLSSAIISEPWE
jgi:hypothetical protein